MMGSGRSERDPAALAVLGTGNNNECCGSATNRTHYPYARHYSNNDYGNNRMESNNGVTASSPTRLVGPNVYNVEEDCVGSSVTVQARYRVHSPALSGRTSEVLLSTSPPFGWSGSGSFHGDVNQHRFPSGADCSAPIPVKSETSVCGVGMRGFSGSFPATGFSMPPALAGSVPLPHSDPRMGSPHREAHAAPVRLGSPPAIFGNTEYKSPILPPVSPPYHGDFQSIQSPTSVVSPHGTTRIFTGGVEKSQSRKSRNSGTIGDGILSVSGSSTDSVPDVPTLCPNDDHCTAINDRKHQQKYVHTCRLFPCYHGHIARHSKLFRHSPGQVTQTEAINTNNGRIKNFPAEALASVNFSSISPQAPNAYRIIVSHGDQSYEIFGDWQSVRVHTFKRYLHQVCKIPPTSQALVREDGDVPLDDDLESVSHYGVKPGTVIRVKHKEDSEPPRVHVDES